MHFNDYNFRIVVDPYGQDAVAQAPRNDELHAVYVVHSLIHLGEDLELRRNASADARNDYLSAVIAPRFL